VWVFTRSGSAWIQQGAALAPDDGGVFGAGVALSADGDTALVSGVVGGAGAVWVFTRTGSTWKQQGRLTVSGGSVALSADGNTALIGDSGDNGNFGAAWVFTRTGSSWTQQGGKLTANDETGAGYFGGSVALSADGNTALIGGPSDNDNVGAAWVFTRTGSSWTQQGPKLTANDETGLAGFGTSVALSGDGDTALVGGPNDKYPVGAAWVFTRSDTTWTQQGSKLVAGGGPLSSGGSSLGLGAALSWDGNTALVGGFLGAWAFTRSGSTWRQQAGPRLAGTGGGQGIFSPFSGNPVALSADGKLALLGGSVRIDSLDFGCGCEPSEWSTRTWVFAPTASDQFGDWFALYENSDSVQRATCTSGFVLVASLTVPYSAQQPPRYTAGLLWIDYFGVPIYVSPTFNLPETGLSALGVDVPLPLHSAGLPFGQYNVHMLLWNDSRQFGTLSATTTYFPVLNPDCSSMFAASAARQATPASATSKPPHRVIVARLRATRGTALAAGKKRFAKLLRVPGTMTSTKTKNGRHRPRARVCGSKVCVNFGDGSRRKTVALP
jgi:hypothetical protein